MCWDVSVARARAGVLEGDGSDLAPGSAQWPWEGPASGGGVQYQTCTCTAVWGTAHRGGLCVEGMATALSGVSKSRGALGGAGTCLVLSRLGRRTRDLDL